MSGNHWRRSRLGWPENAHAGTEDWTLTSPSGERLARVYSVKRDNSAEHVEWLWQVHRTDGIEFEGSASTGEEARRICEQRLADQN
jgi:hypothetical protein